jgi:amino acid permease
MPEIDERIKMWPEVKETRLTNFLNMSAELLLTESPGAAQKRMKLLNRASSFSVKLSESPKSEGKVDMDEAMLTSAEKQAAEDAEEKVGFTTGEAIITYFNSMAGASILVLPYAVNQTGMIGFGILMASTFVMGISAYLIGAGLSYVDAYAVQQNIPKLQRDWSLLGTVAFGEVGKKVISLVFLLDLWGAIIRFLIVAGTNLSILSGGRAPASFGTIGTGIAAFMLMFVPIQYLAKFSMLGILCQVSIFICLILTACFASMSDPSSMGQDVSLFPSEWHSMFTVTGIFIAVFHGQASLPTLFQTMAEPERWGYVVGAGTGLCCLFYFSIACVGYFTFGHSAQQAFTQNLGFDGNGLPVPYMTYAAPLSGGIVALKMIVSLPNFMKPIILFVEGQFGMGNVTRILGRCYLLLYQQRLQFTAWIYWPSSLPSLAP